eukprot:TRINITY_DN42434_c0_g1_i1.p5 TRINITY_DN42434_c0_g1~~TRINITY_DN42434_c0_g1_i1.p5  ORF type:complete len:101 (+),score=19.99 TRINITY_DN42434_c0_g1_i1:74-376(+)
MRGQSTTALTEMVESRIVVITNDGRVIVGLLKGFDQVTNLIMQDCEERIFSAELGVQQLPLGTYIVRGGNIAVVGSLDDELDEQIDWESIRAEPLKHVQH